MDDGAFHAWLLLIEVQEEKGNRIPPKQLKEIGFANVVLNYMWIS